MSILFFKHFVIRKKKERNIVILIILFFFRKAGQWPGLRAKEETVYEKKILKHTFDLMILIISFIYLFSVYLFFC